MTCSIYHYHFQHITPNNVPITEILAWLTDWSRYESGRITIASFTQIMFINY